ncbi:MAG: aldo/keto reductase [Erysipelotrichaceae bacterium]|nr:aldo/keto reductase [Erysipelotrichaceae bacterium]
MEFRTLANNVTIPMEGFGVFQVRDLNDCKEAVKNAIKTGYRLIDTAASYKNEEAVGEAIKECIAEGIVTREELFITTKLWVQDTYYEGAKEAFETSLRKLGLEYLDMYLLHQAMNDYYGAWRALEELYEEGKIRVIGVCNFFPDRLMDLCLHCKVKPMVNQVELHPFFQQEAALRNMQELGVQPEAWGPFAEGSHGIFTNPLLSEIANNHNKSVAQVILRWNVQRGVIVIPKSVHVNRMEQNFDIWDFALTEEEMETIKQLDIGKSEIIDHYNPSIVKMIANNRIHE